MPRTVDAPATRSPVEAWIRVIRPGNLAMIALAMFLFLRRWGIDFWSFPAWAATGGMVALAAGGNMINDYFDIREDAINKPRLALVGRVLKRRVVLISHWGWMALAWSLAGTLSWQMQAAGPLLWAVGLGLGLTFYSPLAKRKFLLGNLLVAAAVAQLPLWAGYVTLGSPFAAGGEGLALAGWAFALTFLREVVKDLQDLEGDRNQGYRTLPVRWGAERTWKWIQTGIALAVAGLFVTASLRGGWASLGYILPALGALRHALQKDVRSLSAWLKVVMGAGLLVWGLG